jgi:hypothetical protein
LLSIKISLNTVSYLKLHNKKDYTLSNVNTLTNKSYNISKDGYIDRVSIELLAGKPTLVKT